MRSVGHRGTLKSLGIGSVLFGLAACSLTTSLDGLTGGTPDSGSVGSTSTTEDGSIVTIGSDGAILPPPNEGDASLVDGWTVLEDSALPVGDDDATAPTDAHVTDAHEAADAHDSSTTPTVDAAPSPFCASQNPTPLFCDDFDEGAIGTPWDQLASTGGSASLSTVTSVSSPDAMLASVNPNASVTSIDVAGYKSFQAKQGVAATATFAFEIRIDAADESASSDAIVGAIQLWNGSVYWDLELEVFYSSATSDFIVAMSEDGSDGTYTPHDVPTHMAMGTWTKVVLSIVVPSSGGSTTGSLSLNGATQSNTVHVLTSDPIPEILVGTTYATPTSGGWSVRYDNVTFNE